MRNSQADEKSHESILKILPYPLNALKSLKSSKILENTIFCHLYWKTKKRGQGYNLVSSPLPILDQIFTIFPQAFDRLMT